MTHHADSSLLPSFIRTKPQLWEHLLMQLTHLLDGQRDWVTFCLSIVMFSYGPFLRFSVLFFFFR